MSVSVAGPVVVLLSGCLLAGMARADAAEVEVLRITYDGGPESEQLERYEVRVLPDGGEARIAREVWDMERLCFVRTEHPISPEVADRLWRKHVHPELVGYPAASTEAPGGWELELAWVEDGVYREERTRWSGPYTEAPVRQLFEALENCFDEVEERQHLE